VCTFVSIICNYNSNWTRCHMVSNHLWTTLLGTQAIKFSLLLVDTITLSSSFLYKLTIVTSHSHMQLKPFCNCKCNFKSFLYGTMEDKYIDSKKKWSIWTHHKHMGWYGHDSLYSGTTQGWVCLRR